MLRIHDDAAALWTLLLATRSVELEPGWVSLECCPDARRHGQLLHAAARHVSLVHDAARVRHGGFAVADAQRTAAWLDGERRRARSKPPAELLALIDRLAAPRDGGCARSLARAMPLQTSERRLMLAAHERAPPTHPGAALADLPPARTLRLPPSLSLFARLAEAAEPCDDGPLVQCVAHNRELGLWVRGTARAPTGRAVARVSVVVEQRAEALPFWEPWSGSVDAVWLPCPPGGDASGWFARQV